MKISSLIFGSGPRVTLGRFGLWPRRAAISGARL